MCFSLPKKVHQDSTLRPSGGPASHGYASIPSCTIRQASRSTSPPSRSSSSDPKPSYSQSPPRHINSQLPRPRRPWQRRPTPNPPQHQPLPSVREILSARHEFAYPCTSNRKRDDPLSAITRISIAILCGRYLDLRNELERFWNQRDWAVSAISDPPTRDPQHRALLAGITYLLVRAFSYRIEELGLPRRMPAGFDDETLAKWRSKPKVLERVPAWAEEVRPLEELLFIPDWAEKVHKGVEDPAVDPDMARFNIVTTMLPIHFV